MAQAQDNTKKCDQCGRPYVPTGRQRYCSRKCGTRAYYLRHKREVIARTGEYQREHRKERNEARRKRRAANREKANANARAYYRAHPDRAAAANRKWARTHPERANAKTRRYYWKEKKEWANRKKEQ